MKKQSTTIEDLAMMVQKGFNQVDEQFGQVHHELKAIRKELVGVVYRREYEELEERVRDLENMLALPSKKLREHIGRWITAMPQSQKRKTTPPQFPIREDKQYHVEVHVAGVCVRENSDGRFPEILIAKRTAKRELFPNKWECGGGQVRPGESFEEAIQRQIYEEFNLSVDVVAVIGTYQIPRTRPQKAKIPGLTFLCVVNGNGEEITLNKREHSECRWIAPSDTKDYRFIGGVAKDIHKALTMLSPREPKTNVPRKIGFAE